MESKRNKARQIQQQVHQGIVSLYVPGAELEPHHLHHISLSQSVGHITQ